MVEVKVRAEAAHGGLSDLVREVRRLCGEARQAIKGTRSLLLKNPWNLTPAQRHRLSSLLRLPGTTASTRAWLRQLPPEVAEGIAYGNGERLFPGTPAGAATARQLRPRSRRARRRR